MQAAFPNMRPPFSLQAGTEQAELSWDVASRRKSRFLWTGFGFAALVLIGISASAPVSNASSTLSRFGPEAAFNPSLPALSPLDIRSAKHAGSSRAPSTGFLPGVLPRVRQHYSLSVPRMSGSSE